jgi:transcriptional regulator with XRE-family HTH domain
VRPRPLRSPAACPMRPAGPDWSRWPVGVGVRLRSARLARGWTLRDVAQVSGGRFRVETLGSWEREERGITPARLAALADLYGTTAAELLAGFPDAPAETMAAGDPVWLAPDRVEDLPPHLAGPVGRYIAAVRAARTRFDTGPVRERAGDIFTLAAAIGTTPPTLLAQLRRCGVLANGKS